MFHYQVGSLEEEPAVLVRHLVRSGHTSVGVAHDATPVGRRYAEFMGEACEAAGLEMTGAAAVPPLAEDVTPTLRRLRAGTPDVLAYLGLGVAARAVALGLEAEGWDVPVVANSALMFGYARRDWRAGWEGWVYVDSVSDDNASRAACCGSARPAAQQARSVWPPTTSGGSWPRPWRWAADLTRQGVRDSLERVKLMAASSGMDGTTMGFGHYDHGACQGPLSRAAPVDGG